MNKHIVFIDDASSFGGAQIALCNALNVLSNEGRVRLTAIVSNSNTKLLDRIGQISCVKVIECPPTYPANIFMFLFRLPAFARILSQVEKSGIDYWVINLSGIEFGLASAILLKIRGLRIFGWLHLSDRLSALMSKSSFAKVAFYRIRDALAELFAFRLYDAFMVPSNSARVTLYKRTKSVRKVCVIYNISRAIARLAIVQPVYRMIVEDKRIIVMAIIGRVDFSHKGQDRTIGIGLELKKRGLLPFFLFIGDGNDSDDLRSKFEIANMHNSFRITGWQEDVSGWLNDVSVVIIPSRFEGLPLVAPEVMALNKRVVSSSLPCFGEVLPPLCISKSNSAEDFADAIVTVLTLGEEELTKLYAPYLEKFSPDAFLRTFDELLHSEVAHVS